MGENTQILTLKYLQFFLTKLLFIIKKIISIILKKIWWVVCWPSSLLTVWRKKVELWEFFQFLHFKWHFTFTFYLFIYFLLQFGRTNMLYLLKTPGYFSIFFIFQSIAIYIARKTWNNTTLSRGSRNRETKLTKTFFMLQIGHKKRKEICVYITSICSIMECIAFQLSVKMLSSFRWHQIDQIMAILCSLKPTL